jgi:hypothetical protein
LFQNYLPKGKGIAQKLPTHLLSCVQPKLKRKNKDDSMASITIKTKVIAKTERKENLNEPYKTVQELMKDLKK